MELAFGCRSIVKLMTGRQRNLVIALFVCFLLGFACGIAVRAWTQPTLGERAEDAAKQLRQSVERVTR